MEQEKVKYLIDMINNMDIKDKLRLAICMSQSKCPGLIYNTKGYYEKFDSMLKDIDEEYRTTLINFGKYKLVVFAMAKLMDFGIFNEETFYHLGWKPIYKYRHDIQWGIDPRVLRRAYQKTMERHHPDVKNPILVLITEMRKDGSLAIRKQMFGVPENDIPKIVKSLTKEGWQTGLSGKLPGMPARTIQIRKGELK